MTIRLCVNPFTSLNVLKSLLLKGAPLSYFIMSGISCVESILSILEMTDCALTEDKISTSGNLEYSSIMTKIYSPVGTAP